MNGSGGEYMMRFFFLVTLLFVTGCPEPDLEPVEGEDPEGCSQACIEGFEDKTCSASCTAEEAETACASLVDALCEANSSVCTGLTFNDCKNDVAQTLNCESVVAVGEKIEECISDVERISVCGEVFPLSCDSVLLREGGVESCEEMASRWICLEQGNRVPSCNAGDVYPSCDCPDGFSENTSGECSELCSSKAITCGANAEKFCSSTFGDFGAPLCRCIDGYAAEDGGPLVFGEGTCMQTCQNRIDNVPANWCDAYPGTSPACGDDIFSTGTCTCDDDFIFIKTTENPDGECVRDRCVDLQPHFTCRDSAGEPDESCSCSCDGITNPSDRPICRCNAGFTYSAAQDACVVD